MLTGNHAPDILGLDQDGNQLKLSDFAGRKLVLYFYPKDNTSGCTAEACSLRDHMPQLKAAGYEVVGVSSDSEASHRKFRDKHSLPFPLIADTAQELQKLMGVWGEKSLYGRKYMGTLRTTFIIGEDGNIEKVFTPREIKTKTHAEQILGI